MADVALSNEQTGHIAWDAYANETDKGSAMAGDGSSGNPYDCVQEALESLSLVGTGNVSVSRLSVGTLSRERASTEATIETDAPHGLAVDDLVSVRGLGGSGYNHEQVYVTGVDSATLFRYTWPLTSDETNTSDTGGTISRYHLYDVEFIGSLANRNMDTLIAANNLTGGVTPDVVVTETQAGDTSTNERQRVRLNGQPTGGTFQLTVTMLTGKMLEVSQAMQWIKDTLEADSVISGAVPSDRIFFNKIPPGPKGNMHPQYLVIKPVDTRDSRWLGRNVRSKATNYIQVKVVSPEDQPAHRTRLISQRLSEIFEHQINQTIDDGLVLSCTRQTQIAVTEEDIGQSWTNLGVLIQVNVRQNA